MRVDKVLAGAGFRRIATKEGMNTVYREIEKRVTAPEQLSYLSFTETASYIYTSMQATPRYVPLTWDASDTIVLTWTIPDTDTRVDATL